MTSPATLLGGTTDVSTSKNKFFAAVLEGRVGDEEIFIDRNPRYFEAVLDILRGGELYVPVGLSRDRLLLELDYYHVRRPTPPSPQMKSDPSRATQYCSESDDDISVVVVSSDGEEAAAAAAAPPPPPPSAFTALCSRLRHPGCKAGERARILAALKQMVVENRSELGEVLAALACVVSAPSSPQYVQEAAVDYLSQLLNLYDGSWRSASIVSITASLVGIFTSLEHDRPGRRLAYHRTVMCCPIDACYAPGSDFTTATVELVAACVPRLCLMARSAVLPEFDRQLALHLLVNFTYNLDRLDANAPGAHVPTSCTRPSVHWKGRLQTVVGTPTHSCRLSTCSVSWRTSSKWGRRPRSALSSPPLQERTRVFRFRTPLIIM